MGMHMKVAVGYGLDLTGLNTGFISKYENLENKAKFTAFVEQALASANGRDDWSDRSTIGFAMGTPHHEASHAPPESFADMIDHDSEFAFADKLLLYPIGYKRQWKRGWNDLDHFIYEAYRKPEDLNMTPEWREKPGPLYPFMGSLMRANPEKPLGIETYWVPCYMDHPEHRNAAPTPPLHLWHLIRHLHLTEDDAATTAAFLTLRPTLMRWWS